MNVKFYKSVLFVWVLACSCGLYAQTSESFKFVALGDMPYKLPDDEVRYERLISEINKLNPSFSIFIGDTKSGSTPCSDEYNLKVRENFNQFSSPLIYSIGDNEWTDCHRPLAGGYDPLERLNSLRSSFFNTNKSFGKKKLLLTRQGDIDPAYKKFTENAYWVKNRILFVNLHIPGSNNNFEREESAKAEYQERNLANLAWIKQMFLLAKAKQYAAIVFAYQADMFYTPNQASDPDSGYKDTLHTLSHQAQEFKKPVLLIHGDSHRLIIDQPLKTVDQKYSLENVLRLQVMGAEQVQAVEINVNPLAEQPFDFRPILLKQNWQHPSP